MRRSPHSISLAEIVAAVCGADPQPDPITLQLVEGQGAADWAVQEAWRRATAAMSEVMGGITLHMLAERQVELRR